MVMPFDPRGNTGASALTRWPLVACAALLIAATSWAQSPGTKAIGTIAFAPGSTTAVLEGDVSTPSTVGEDRTNDGGETYVLHAKAGQRLRVRLASSDQHAVFSLIKPSPAMSRIEFVPKAAGVTQWSGRLALSGDYVVEVFTHDNRQVSHFRLQVTLR